MQETSETEWIFFCAKLINRRLNAWPNTLKLNILLVCSNLGAVKSTVRVTRSLSGSRKRVWWPRATFRFIWTSWRTVASKMGERVRRLYPESTLLIWIWFWAAELVFLPSRYFMQGNPNSWMPAIFACGMGNPGLWNLEYSSRNPESHLRFESRIHVPLTKTGIQFLESGIQGLLFIGV